MKAIAACLLFAAAAAADDDDYDGDDDGDDDAAAGADIAVLKCFYSCAHIQGVLCLLPPPQTQKTPSIITAATVCSPSPERTTAAPFDCASARHAETAHVTFPGTLARMPVRGTSATWSPPLRDCGRSTPYSERRIGYK